MVVDFRFWGWTRRAGCSSKVRVFRALRNCLESSPAVV